MGCTSRCPTPRGAECHCGNCHQTFGGLSLFEAHQDRDYGRPRGMVVLCRDPATMTVHPTGLYVAAQGVRLTQTARGTWITPAGLNARLRSATALGKGRSSRGAA